MKSGHLIEYNTRNIFLEKSYIKCGAEIIPRVFSKKSILSILSLQQQPKVLIQFFFIIYVLRKLVPIVLFKKNMKKAHGGVLPLVKLHAFSLQLY